jgi:hypothetical protein
MELRGRAVAGHVRAGPAADGHAEPRRRLGEAMDAPELTGRSAAATIEIAPRQR